MAALGNAKLTWDHIHLRTLDPEAMARWFESMLGAEVVRTMQQGKPRIDLKLGGANIFIAPVETGDGVHAAPTTPYRGLDHFGLAVTGIDAIAADLKANRRPATMQPDEAVVYDFCTELSQQREVSDETFDRARKLLGDQGVVDLVAVSGTYVAIAMMLSAAEEGVPPGKEPPFKPGEP